MTHFVSHIATEMSRQPAPGHGPRTLQLLARSRSDPLCQYLSLNIFISENVTTSVILYACHSIPVYGAYLENLLQIHVIPAKQTSDALGPCISSALCNGLFFASFIRFYKDSSTGDQHLMDNPDIIRPFNGYYTTRLVTKFHDN